jgi:hypothetical protein
MGYGENAKGRPPTVGFFFAAFILSRHLKDIGSQVDTRVPYSCFAKHTHNCFTMIRQNMDWESVTPPDGYLCHQYRYRAARFAQHYFENRRHAEAGTMLKLPLSMRYVASLRLA